MFFFIGAYFALVYSAKIINEPKCEHSQYLYFAIVINAAVGWKRV